MEYKCEYCSKPYLPKRTDSLYCSHTCRQLAYVLRKAQSGLTLQGSDNNKHKKSEIDKSKLLLDAYLSEEKETAEPSKNLTVNNLSVNTEKKNELPVRTDIPVNTDKQKLAMDWGINRNKSFADIDMENLSVNTDNEIPVNTSKIIPVNTDKLIVNTDKAIPVNTDMKGNAVKADQEYKEYPSQYLKELDILCEDRDNYHALGDLMQKDEAGGWITERYRCLLECLLLFSEMKEIKLDDLKEVCNAFTDIILSRHYANLHPNYPYKNEIKQMRERIKKKCLNSGNNEILKYKLSREEKQMMMAIRFELSQFVPKRKFDELKFTELKIKKGG
ncbi:MAG: hypothetical protein H0W84_04205 [Bacteroidetes bacterium]|nr:hypothetical protein [Bacteroidota bacterium]